MFGEVLLALDGTVPPASMDGEGGVSQGGEGLGGVAGSGAAGVLAAGPIADVVQAVASRPEEFHPRPLTERCGSLSAHTAPTKQPVGIRVFGMSNDFVAAKVSSCCQLDVDDNRLAQPLCSGRMTGLPRSYGLVRPCAPHGYARLVVVATWTSPVASERQVPAVPHESPDQTRASSTPVAIRPVSRCPTD